MDDFLVKAIAISLHIQLAFEEVDIVVEFFLYLILYNKIIQFKTSLLPLNYTLTK